MIASIRGVILERGEDSVVVAVGGAGLRVYLPRETLETAQIGEEGAYFTHLVVREDSLSLYGFPTVEARVFFGLLLGVNGVGPRLAMAVLSTLSPDAIRRAVFHEQAEVFSRVPGVGKKTAQKILLQLQDRIPAEAGLEPVAVASDLDLEVIAALTALGYSVVEAQAALQALPRDVPDDLETRLRLALQTFSS